MRAMENQFDGRAVAHALRGLADLAPAPGDLPAILQQLGDTAKTVLAADGIGCGWLMRTASPVRS
jgi:hypothetical protein